ncbi:MAG TPA: NAD(P)-binding domain-containing protein, partial [Thermoplasmata archaeon]|nr:NAD(P)-binding domain-containing protein [Thermoplasmata archaeon]
MNNKKIAIIGGGNMGVALAKGIIQTKWADPKRIMIAEPLKDKHDQLKAIAKGVKVSPSNLEAAKFADVIILSVKPQIMLRVIDEIKPALKGGK